MSSADAPPKQPARGEGPYRSAKLVVPTSPLRARVVPYLVAATAVLMLVGLNTWRRARRLMDTPRVTPLREESRAPRFIPLEGVTQLARVGGRTCAAMAAGAVYCWMPEARLHGSPRELTGGYSVALRRTLIGDDRARLLGPRSEVLSISSLLQGGEGRQRHHQYRLEADGRVRLIAYDLGPNGRATRLVETFVSGLPRATELVEGPCIRSQGQVWCWCDHYTETDGALAHLDDLTRPVRVEGDFEALSLSSSQYSDLYASSTRGEVWRWRRYDPEHLGTFIAARVAGFHDVTRAFAVDGGVCGLHSNGSISCAEMRYGLPESGDLPHIQRVRPIEGVRGITDVVGDVEHVCGITPAVPDVEAPYRMSSVARCAES